MPHYNLIREKKETCLMNFSFTMRDVFTKKKRRKGKKEKKERRGKIEFSSLTHLVFQNDKMLYCNLSK